MITLSSNETALVKANNNNQGIPAYTLSNCYIAFDIVELGSEAQAAINNAYKNFGGDIQIAAKQYFCVL